MMKGLEIRKVVHTFTDEECDLAATICAMAASTGAGHHYCRDALDVDPTGWPATLARDAFYFVQAHEQDHSWCEINAEAEALIRMSGIDGLGFAILE